MRLRNLTLSKLAPLWSLAFVLGVACGEPESEPGPSEVASESAALTSFPTKWTLVNKTRQTLTFSCSCPKPRGLLNPINMATTTVLAGGTKVVNWGDWWYNDGLGLNACTWNCSAKDLRGVYGSLTFSTSWGENISLTAKSTGGLAVAR